MQKVNFAPRFPVNESFDMCNPFFGDENISSAESPIAGYFGTGSKVVNSAYEVPLKHGIPIKLEGKTQDGHDKCFSLCKREWSVTDVQRFEKLVGQNYGYRLFLDDLPSATKYDGRDHYDE